MGDGATHADCVDAWLERSDRDRPPERRLQLFEAALEVLWASTRTTLGAVTLTAIVERVLYNAGERFPAFSSLKVDPESGIQCKELRERARFLDDRQLREGIRFVLVEFLTVLGNVTAEILTPEAHAELMQVGGETRAQSKDAES